MSPAAWVLMAVVCGVVWGGFTLLLARALREEGKKTADRLDEHPPHPSP